MTKNLIFLFFIIFTAKTYGQIAERKACRDCINSSKNIKVTVYVSFRLNPDSSITNIQVVRSHCPTCDKDALKIFSRKNFDNLVSDKPLSLIHPKQVISN